MKHGLGKLPLPEEPERLVPRLRQRLGLQALPVDEEVSLEVPRLPDHHRDHHRDPFDRMLVCQARVQAMVLVTPDATIARYPVRVLW